MGLSKIALLVVAWALVAAAHAESFRVVPSISLEETLTNNVNVVPKPGEQSDLITALTPAFNVSEKGARTSLSGNVSFPILFYARTGADNNRVTADANLIGKVEVVDKFFFIDGTAMVSQQNFTALGARPPSIESGNQNRYTSQSYSLSPYITSVIGRDIQYEVRNTGTWTRLTDTPSDTTRFAYTNQASATVSKTPVPLGWDLSYSRTDVKFHSQQQPFVSQIARFRAIDQVDPELQVFLTAGYENNDYAISKFSNTIYGAGGRWQPNARLSVDGNWEHRFFGSAYELSVSYRRPLTWLSVTASRDVSTLPQQLGAVPGAFDLQAILNQLFLTQIPDPIQRQQFIDQYIRDHDLTQLLSGPVTLFTQQAFIVEQARASLGLLGVRNTVVLTAYYSRTSDVTELEAVNPAGGFSTSTQRGASVSWTYNLGSGVDVITSADASHAVGNGTVVNGPSQPKTTQGSLHVSLSKSLSANTSVHGGARYVVVRSNFADNTQEAAIFVGVTHTFH